MISSKEIALKALNRVRTDPVPVGIFLGGVRPILHSGLTLEKLIGDYEKPVKINFKVIQKLGADIHLKFRKKGGEAHVV